MYTQSQLATGFWDANLTVTVLTAPQTCRPYCTQWSLCRRDAVYIQTLHSTPSIIISVPLTPFRIDGDSCGANIVAGWHSSVNELHHISIKCSRVGSIWKSRYNRLILETRNVFLSYQLWEQRESGLVRWKTHCSCMPNHLSSNAYLGQQSKHRCPDLPPPKLVSIPKASLTATCSTNHRTTSCARKT